MKIQKGENGVNIERKLTGVTRDKNGKVIGFTYILDKGDGKPKEVELDKDGNIKGGRSKGPDAEYDKFVKEAQTEFSKFKTRQFFADIERGFSEFQSLSYYSTFFFSDDALMKWQDNVDKIFAKAYLGTEYWSSAICSKYLDSEQFGVVYAETPQGLAQVGAHIEATRSSPARGENGTSVIYKITFNVRNGDFDKDPRAPETMNVNVLLKGKVTARVFKENQEVKRGETFGKTGKDAIVKESRVIYDTVCLQFDKLPSRWKLDNNELCNKIVESSIDPLELDEGSSDSGSSGDSGGDLNDF